MNEQKTNPLGTEKISNLLLRFAIPSIIAMVVSALYNMVDEVLGCLGMQQQMLPFL